MNQQMQKIQLNEIMKEKAMKQQMQEQQMQQQKTQVWCADGVCRSIDLQNYAINAEGHYLKKQDFQTFSTNLKDMLDSKYVSKSDLINFAKLNNLKY